MNAVIAAAAGLQAVCEDEGWRFCFIGGLAVLRWGEPREMVDVDLTLITGFRDEASVVSVLLGRYEPRIARPLEFARVNRVLLLRAASGVGLDIALGGLPFEESRGRRPPARAEGAGETQAGAEARADDNGEGGRAWDVRASGGNISVLP